jgi:gliding motility-associated-like protein
MSQINLGQGLILHMPFDGNANDASVYKNNGTLTNVSFAADPSGNANGAAYFNGLNSVISVPHSASLASSNKALSISIKVYSEDENEAQFILLRGMPQGNGNGPKVIYSINFSALPGQAFLFFSVRKPEACSTLIQYVDVTSTQAITEQGKWTCITAVYDGKTIKMYKDGILRRTEPAPAEILDCGDHPLFIGAPMPGYYTSYKGRLDELRIYNRVLTADEISFLSVGCTLKCPSPVTPTASAITDSSARISWAGTSLNTGFDMQRRDSANQTWMTDFSNQDITDKQLTGLKSGTPYQVRIRARCGSDSSEWVTVDFRTTSPPPPPIPSITIRARQDSCLPARYSFTATIQNIRVSELRWEFGDGGTASTLSTVHNYVRTGTYGVKLIITDSSGRVTSGELPLAIEQLQLSFASAGNDAITCADEKVSLAATGGTNYSWSPCTGLSACNIPNPEVAPGTNATYVVTVTNAAGCTDRDTVMVKTFNISDQLYIPNAFTPNGDGVNDLFRPLANATGIGQVDWSVYDRFGEQIFHSASGNEGWNGRHKGKDQPSGSYIYKIILKGSGNCPPRELKGTVMLMR